jgi:hypothetical protein
MGPATNAAGAGLDTFCGGAFCATAFKVIADMTAKAAKKWVPRI